ncbi:MAG TPA: hypothetical protein VLL28_12975 [Hyphomicrobiaceae bacterium]|nr:hypothetical protein [Hyphomicrobiaceae bacterium]
MSRDSRDHHRQFLHERTQDEVEDDNGDEHLHRRQLKVGDEAAQLLRQSDRLDHDIEEEGPHEDRHDHCRRAHGGFADLPQHGESEAPAPGRDGKGPDDAHRSRLSGGSNAEEDRADDDHEESKRGHQIRQQGNALPPIGRNLIATPARSPDAADQHGQTEKDRQNESRNKTSKIEFRDRSIGHHTVDDHVDRGRDQNAKRSTRRQRAKEQRLVVLVLVDLTHGNDADRGCRCNARSRNRAEQRAGSHI